ncbi:MAG: Rieske 2Fe-2S domain-containing protein [Fibrobacterota bacterium]|nr:Rieske 2Fe-2S domain-containing protein [Fibrobacterota bacterium]QQS06082.1 MAG: Rieske 2Fe-2S domain-containing protein [Fibrobacterota bacterium]
MPDELNRQAAPDDPERRDVLKFAAAGALGAVYAGLVGYPVYKYLASPIEKAAAETVVTEMVVEGGAALPKNAALMFKFGAKPAMLIHHEDGSYSALSAVCTHLGCTASYEPDQKRIFCACHGGVYDALTGANVSGPPPKPLTAFKVQVTDGKIVVRRA